MQAAVSHHLSWRESGEAPRATVKLHKAEENAGGFASA